MPSSGTIRRSLYGILQETAERCEAQRANTNRQEKRMPNDAELFRVPAEVLATADAEEFESLDDLEDDELEDLFGEDEELDESDDEELTEQTDDLEDE